MALHPEGADRRDDWHEGMMFGIRAVRTKETRPDLKGSCLHGKRLRSVQGDRLSAHDPSPSFKETVDV